ncbi:hypothetical protein [Azospirillum canadense]|uniref:hypothetical protein n=1 Tax=Azospirillum canadense TaxID=403962 RepID=UPI002225FFAB|nr:hypothetical protein [Azospirillum canadense]MCW2236965.1 hypothetical protein [Azospirillum canadense]
MALLERGAGPEGVGPEFQGVGEVNMRRKREVVEGQLFRKLGPGGGIWEVIAVRKDGLGTQHAQMQRADDPKTLKTLAVSTLLDPSQFEMVAEQP